MEEKPEQAAAPGSAWGDSKDCPICGETIKSIALKCRFCESEFDTVDPLTARDLRRQSSQSEKLKSVRNSTVAVFVVSLFGCPAPLTLLLSLGMVLRQRDQISQCGLQFLVMAYAGLGLSTIYTILIILFIFFEAL